MPTSGDYFIGVLGYHNAWKGQSQVTLQVRQHQLVIVPAAQKVVRGRREPDASDVGRMRLETLHVSSSSNVVQDAGRILVTGNQQSSARIDAQTGNWRALTRTGLGDGGYHVDAASRAQVPEPNGFIVGTTDEHSTTPGV